MTKLGGYVTSQLARSSDNFLILCNYLMGLLAIGYPPEKKMAFLICVHGKIRDGLQ